MSSYSRRGVTVTINPPEEKKRRNWVAESIAALLSVALIELIWPDFIPFSYFELWGIKEGTVLDWLQAGVPVFIWGAALAALYSIFTRNNPKVNARAEQHFVAGAFTSLRAGIFEEIGFRWILFMNGIVVVEITNYFLGGFAGLTGLTKWLHLHFFGPIANGFTLGYLEEYLVKPEVWYLGAAILVTNAFFRDGHKYQGFVGWVNSWFGGMYLFWIMFQFGLPAAILVHFVYNFIIDVVRYVDMVAERKFDLARA
ncbi:MAG TPA: CPBP family glutamic-type intramembrane protease [Verrucomicrobiae bacterium]|nr:CPBP family glutamic-type intramembrane protease [Verrucomicrobiae bacterium]